MAKADPKTISELENTLNSVADGFPKVTGKKMFGCHALWANGNVFALVWKEGRIGLKLTETSDFEKLISTKDAAPWKAGPMAMSHWVLVPKTFHEKKNELLTWAKKAHAQALSAPAKKPAAKKAAKKKKN